VATNTEDTRKGSSESILAACRGLQLSNANEAATRLKVIDRILREVLSWTNDDIEPEQHVSEDGTTTYADYILRTANTAVIVEAKRVGSSFESTTGRRREKLSQQFLSGELGKAITQARDYARKLSIDNAVVTNGSAWIIFPAQRHDQVGFHDSSAIAFWTLEDALKDNFQEFVDLLSRDAVISGSLDLALLGRSQNQLADRKLRNFFASVHRPMRTNPIFPVIEEGIVAAFSEAIVDLSPEQLEKCYVATPETQRFDSKIRMHVARRQSVVSRAPLKAMKDADADQLNRRISSAVSTKRPLALLLLGTVGAGKTTFLHHLRRVRLAESFTRALDRPYPHWLHVDFLEKYPGGEASKFIYDELFSYIKSDPFLRDFERCVKHAYAEEIEALKSGPLFLLTASQEKLEERIADLIMDDYKKVVPYVDRILKYATSNTPFFLVIDNVDQIEDEIVQSRLFTESLSIARHLSLNLVLALRQSTYVAHRNSPAIDAFDFEVVQIDPPRISSVLSKRFNLARALLSGRRGEFTAENGARIKLENVAEIIDLVQGSVLGTEIGKLIEVLAADDVRLALRMTREFLERGYSNPGRAIEFHRKTGGYVLPKHEAFRAIILGNSPVYNEELSVIGNPFDSNLSIHNAQLLRLFLLTASVNYASSTEFRAIDGSLISEMMRKIGFGDLLTEQVLIDLCRFRFMFTASHGAPSLSSSFVPSRLGGYIVRDLIGYMPFLENTMFDTYIRDSAAWEDLRSLSQTIDSERNTTQRVWLRTQRVRVFFREMQRLYAPLLLESQKRGLPAEWCHDPLAERFQQLRGQLSKALRSARRGYGPRRAFGPLQPSQLATTDEFE